MCKQKLYKSIFGTLYPIEDVCVKPFSPVFTVMDGNGGSISTAHDAFAIYQVSTGHVLDTFDGYGYGTVSDAEEAIKRRTVYDIPPFDYQSVENVPTILECDFDAMNRDLGLTKLEYYRLCLFKENHEECGHGQNTGTIGVGYKLIFSFNSVCRSVVVECPFCGHTADITDYGAW